MELTVVQGRRRGVHIGLSEAQRVDGVRDVEGGRQRGVEVVDVLAVAHDAVSVGDVEVARHLVHLHAAPDVAAFAGIDGVEGDGAVALALRAVAQDGAHVPLLGLIRAHELIARIAAPINRISR